MIAFLLASSSPGQFQHLATTDDGAVLYFSSRFRQTGEEGQAPHPKVFRWSGGQFSLIAQREASSSGRAGSFHQFLSPNVSGDGNLLTAIAYRPCVGGSGCVYVERFSPEILRGDAPPDLPTGKIQLSRNGRFLLLYGSTALPLRVVERIDLESGERVSQQFPFGWVSADRQSITSDGRVLLASQGALSLWDGHALIRVEVNATPFHAVVSDNAAWAVYERGQFDGPKELWAVSMDGSTRVQLASVQEASFYPSLSNDGRMVAFVADRRVVVADLVSGTLRVLDEPTGYATEATISGDGTVVYAATSRNTLWRIGLTTQEASELVPGVVAADAIWGAPVPGSLNWIRGSGLAERMVFGQPPFPLVLDGVQVEIGGERAAIIAAAPEQIVFQIPWEARLGKSDVAIAGPQSPFEQISLEVELRDRAPDFVQNGFEAYAEGLPLGAFVVIDQDFQALVTAENRAREGDLVHLYATGLGASQEPFATGELTPIHPLPTLRNPIECKYFNGATPNELDVLYAGLAPGLIGTYQITIRIPKGVQPFAMNSSIGSLTARCGAEERGEAFFSVPLRFED